MCGVVGIYGKDDPVINLCEALILLQHRGQDAAGAATYDARSKHLHQFKGSGLVRDAFKDVKRGSLIGDFGIGHVRYPTAGGDSADEIQPFYVNSPCGVALAHNGNLVNADELLEELTRENLRYINTGSDSEILLNVLAHELMRQNPSPVPEAEKIFAAVERLHKRCRGAYSVVALVVGFGLLAFRDPLGIRPLIYGVREGLRGKEYMFASESVAPDSLGFSELRDVQPGEAVLISLDGRLQSRQCVEDPVLRGCAFEYVYFARPDSMIDKVFVHKARMRMGEYLSRKIRKVWPDHDIDVVIPVPDTSRTVAQEIAVNMGLTHREGFIKNRYVGRTFIMPRQGERYKSVRRKLHPLSIEFKNKNVLLVDDSVVRGTTSKQIIQLARDAGANKVYFASASPPVRYPSVYGINMPTAKELVAHNQGEDSICRSIGADRLFYQDLPDLIQSVRAGNPEMEQLECSVFDGQYAHKLTPHFFNSLERKRGSAMQRRARRTQQEYVI